MTVDDLNDDVNDDVKDDAIYDDVVKRNVELTHDPNDLNLSECWRLLKAWLLQPASEVLFDLATAFSCWSLVITDGTEV